MLNVTLWPYEALQTWVPQDFKPVLSLKCPGGVSEYDAIVTGTDSQLGSDLNWVFYS